VVVVVEAVAGGRVVVVPGGAGLEVVVTGSPAVVVRPSRLHPPATSPTAKAVIPSLATQLRIVSSPPSPGS
jgi:hypothetical protein